MDNADFQNIGISDIPLASEARRSRVDLDKGSDPNHSMAAHEGARCPLQSDLSCYNDVYY